LPLKKDSDYLDVRDRFLADTWDNDKTKLLNRINESYRKAPFYNPAIEVIGEILKSGERNLFKFIFDSLAVVNQYLGIKTKMIVSSSVNIDHSLKSSERVMAICKARKADKYINPIGGLELYHKDDFKKNGIELNFLSTKEIRYDQFKNEFVPWLSIIDVMMFNSKEKIRDYLENYYSLI
jgi:WbqC-like protein family